MQRQQSGKIVNLAVDRRARAQRLVAASPMPRPRAASSPLPKSSSYELGPYGININAIAPSVTLTERIRPHWERRSQEEQAAEIDKTPLRRVAEAVDQARVICFLASRTPISSPASRST